MIGADDLLVGDVGIAVMSMHDGWEDSARDRS
jgi:hypothetical protein